ncbi:hypothetical protein SLEP1_g43312 [Rubroshorea leprosula]|uniref:Uncharacterized protein n=1 Tax=Rubroshorea leprosula TaxID=152421 RepID=A0AAV5LCJ6_9ROSI|nr:hypothetical protein SLEP1_g43312 [Rubroshorea leprosula]
MAFFTEKGASASLVLILCLVVFHEVSDCTSGSGCFYANAAHSHSRKTLAGFKEKEVAQGFLHRSTSTGNRENLVGWELRTVPSGPDPLHHNGGSPKKPRTP